MRIKDAVLLAGLLVWLGLLLGYYLVEEQIDKIGGSNCL
jgi:hypothetical protein